MVAPAIDVLFVVTVGVICSVIFFSFDGEIGQTIPTAGIVLVVFNRLLPHFKQLNTMRSTYAGLSSRIEQIGELMSEPVLAKTGSDISSPICSMRELNPA